MDGQRVLICGGRDFDDGTMVSDVMQANFTSPEKIACIIQGGASGADYLGKLWAEGWRIPVIEMPAPWRQFGKRAGPVRNQWMIDHGKPDLVIAFPGGAGTADMIARAEKADIRVIRVELPT